MTIKTTNCSDLQKWEFSGIVFIFVIGSFLHFVYDLSGELFIFAIIGAVNESVWEHLKLGFWPAFFYSLIQLKFIKNLNIKSFIIAKASSMYIIPITIIILFYSWEGTTGIHFLLIDLIIFLIAVSLGQLISYQLMIRKNYPKNAYMFGFTSIVFLIVVFTIFTFFPPNVPIFQESTGNNMQLLRF
ncbi:MAG: DUF6512 family protein [Promethearchaeota archaeon]